MQLNFLIPYNASNFNLETFNNFHIDTRTENHTCFAGGTEFIKTIL